MLRQHGQNAGLDQQLERPPGRSAAHQPVDLLEQPGRRALADLAAPAQERIPRPALEAEVEARGELDRAQDPHRILLEPDVRIADRADQLGIEIGQPTDVVDDLLALDVVEQPVDREVAAARVLGLGAEHVVAADQQIVIVLVARVGAERRGLDDLGAEEHVGEAKSPPDDPAIAKRRLDLVGRRAGRDIEVLRRFRDEQIANTAADQICLVACSGELADHAIGVRVDRSSVERRHLRETPVPCRADRGQVCEPFR